MEKYGISGGGGGGIGGGNNTNSDGIDNVVFGSDVSGGSQW